MDWSPSSFVSLRGQRDRDAAGRSFLIGDLGFDELGQKDE